MTWLTDELVTKVTRTLKTRGASDDNVQDTLVKLLELATAPRDPVAWAITAGWRAAADAGRRQQTVLRYATKAVSHGSQGTASSGIQDNGRRDSTSVDARNDHPTHLPLPIEEMTPERVALLNEAISRGYVACDHLDRPRYGDSTMCRACYMLSWRRRKRYGS